MQLETAPYLSFEGRCKEAFEFYARTLGGKIAALFPYGGSPMEKQAPPGWGEKIMHARLELPSGVILGSDVTADRYRKTSGISLALQVDDVSEAERIFAALAEGGEVQMPLQQTFWAVRFGMMRDRYGIPWMVNCEAKA